MGVGREGARMGGVRRERRCGAKGGCEGKWKVRKEVSRRGVGESEREDQEEREIRGRRKVSVVGGKRKTGRREVRVGEGEGKSRARRTARAMRGIRGVREERVREMRLKRRWERSWGAGC